MQIINPLFFSLPSSVRGQVQEMDALDEVAFIAQGTQRDLALYCQNRTIHFNRDGTGFVGIERALPVDSIQLIHQVFRWKSPDCLVAATDKAAELLSRMEAELEQAREQNETEYRRRFSLESEQQAQRLFLAEKYGNARGEPGTIQISIDNPRKGSQVQSIAGEIFGDFGVHKDLGARTNWVITHLGTGLAAARFPKRSLACVLAARLRDLIDPGSDANVIRTQVGALIRQAQSTGDVYALC